MLWLCAMKPQVETWVVYVYWWKGRGKPEGSEQVARALGRPMTRVLYGFYLHLRFLVFFFVGGSRQKILGKLLSRGMIALNSCHDTDRFYLSGTDTDAKFICAALKISGHKVSFCAGDNVVMWPKVQVRGTKMGEFRNVFGVSWASHFADWISEYSLITWRAGLFLIQKCLHRR